MPKPKQPNNNDDDSLSSSSTCNNTVAIQQLRFSVAIDVNDGQESGCNNHEHHLQHSIFTTDNLSYQDSTLSQCSKMIILKELIRTENLYLNYFEILKEKIIQSLSRCNILTPEEVEKTFCLSQLNILFKVNTELLNQFKQVESLLMTNQQSSPTLMPTNGSSPRARNSLGQTFLRLTPFLKNYVQYSHMLEPCLIQFRNRKLKDKSFKAIVKKLQRFCTKLLFDALREDDSCEKCNEFEIIQTMKMPLRRILYYRDVLTQLLKLTPITNDEYSPLSESLKLIEIVSQSFEQQITELDHKDKFYEINKKV
ncbi:hypothetical protein C9374_007773 [Naegleria lovaniensis]|uniref:DH domain-containing protein n=1 Tax=Naegleria lovaniensis TaxID=51637 RepID=A0AA88KH23_NAELO|nr:uncharacterized protein C9374_007773 [Naegleria lovaniensis]KAG2379135.1 hypothetical protein C9374_007773 [Naegleria lovaniensis]